MFQVPANRIGAQAGWSGFQLKVTQEVITVIVFVVFAVYYLKEPVRWNHAAAFVLLVGAVGLVFWGKPAGKRAIIETPGLNQKEAVKSQ